MTAATTEKGADQIPITVEFTGGLEMLFSNQRTHKLTIPSHDDAGKRVNIAYLVRHLTDNLRCDNRKELFVVGDYEVRPGILVLINDADWELYNEYDYEIEAGDTIVFVSTLHGG